MAHPYIFASNFEAGTNAEWDSETDTGSKLDFPHYTDLARISGMPAPYRGAFCARWDLTTGDTNDHTLIEGDIDIADAGTAYFRWYMFVSTNFTATADDTFNFFELQQAGGTVEVSTGFRVTAATNALDIGIGDGTAPTSFFSFPRGRWVCVELAATISTGGSGAVTLYLDGAQVVALTSQTHAAAVGRGVLGTQDTLSTTTGVILVSEFVMDDGRLYPYKQRFPVSVPVTKSGHVFVGRGTIEGAVLQTLTSGDTLRLYDTDTGNINDDLSFVTELTDSVHTSVAGPIYFERGCYASITDGARGEVYLTANSQKRGIIGPVNHWSDGAIRTYAQRRRPRVQNV